MKRNLFSLLLTALLICGTCLQCSKADHQTPPELNKPDTDQPDDEEVAGDYPKGVTVKSFTDQLPNGSSCLGYYAIVDFSENPKLEFHPRSATARKPSAHYAAAESEGIGTPCVATNGGYFNGSLQSLSLLIDDGVVRSIALKDDYIWSTTPYTHFFPVRAAIGRFENGKIEAAWVYCVDSDSKPFAFPSALENNEKESVFRQTAPTSSTPDGRSWKPQMAIGGGPMLIQNGANVAETNYWKEIFDCGGVSGLTRQPRTAIGATADGKLVLIVCDGRNKRGSAGFTLPELADKLIELGCVIGINLDGGGSSTFVGKGGQVLNMPSDTSGTTLEGATIKERSVPTAVVITEHE